MSKNQPKLTVAQLVDQLGIVKAQAAKIAEEEQALKDALILRGVKTAEGDFFRVNISLSDRETLDMAAVRAKLSRQFISRNTKITSVITVRVSARVADPVASAA